MKFEDIELTKKEMATSAILALAFIGYWWAFSFVLNLLSRN